MLRTYNCGELTRVHIDKLVILCGWVQSIRNKNKIVWIDLRDRFGIIQLVFEKNTTPEIEFLKLKDITRESVISIEGLVIRRKDVNKNILTGEIEVEVKKLTLLNQSNVPPFKIIDETDGGEELRMKYRYLDLRRPILNNNIVFRSKLIKIFRDLLDNENFLEIETPLLIKSTPEGARDFVVPSRLYKDKFYALPQSPQTFKQLLMLSGFDRYYQVAKCLRDEDLRADRQPEFSQMDCELSFVDQEDILDIFEKIIRNMFSILIGVNLPKFLRMSYEEAMNTYGTDKPDLRFEMPISDITKKGKIYDFNIFQTSELIAGICLKKGSNMTRKKIDNYTSFVKSQQIGAKGLIYIKFNEDGSIKSSIDKFLMPTQIKVLCESLNFQKGDLVFIISGKKLPTLNALSELRLKLAKDFDLYEHEYVPLWVTDFPLFEWNEDQDRYISKHHPFTAPHEEDLDLLKRNPSKIRSKAYDLVLNGWEVGGGSIRIHKYDIQKKIFDILNLSEKEVNKNFNFLLEALKFGAPPHGGIAFGIARLCSLMNHSNSIRDYIAFPKNNAARDPMIDAPSFLEKE